MEGSGAKVAKAHLAYLERDGVERDGSPGRLYGPDKSFEVETFRAPLEGEPRQFRFIVSPEDAHQLDLTLFARQLMTQVEKDTGRRLDWAGVNHYNTDNPHVHIVVRGLDRDGDELRIDGRYIAREMRWRAQEIVTRELGRRHEMDLSLSRNPEIERARFTHLDRVLETLVSPEGLVSLDQVLAEPGREGRSCVARLQTLARLGLAVSDGASVWRLEPDWQQALKDSGESSDVLERLKPLLRERAIEFQIVDELRPVQAFEGRVVGKGLDDELGGRMFVAIETSDRRCFYVRMAPQIAEPMREGEIVRVGFDAERWLKPADRIIARFAEEHGGLYDPPRHERALETLRHRQVQIEGPTSAERVAANIRRLERLERYGLVARLPDGRWQVRPDLLKQLEERERTHPRPKMQVERLGLARTAALGNQVSIGPNRPASAPSNVPHADQERAALGQALAKQSHRIFVGDPPTFRGWVVDCVTAPSGRQYARVMNELRGEFTLIPKPPQWERIHGTTISLALDRERRLVIQRDLGLSR
jgi:type IV secretory pathway VirD2 relaxase